MKGLYRYLSPFSPDQSGAVAVLYELGGIIVILTPAAARETSVASTSPAGGTNRAPCTRRA